MTDEQLLRQFENCLVPSDGWTHRAHVRLGFLYARDFPFDEALARVRDGVKALNAKHQVPETETRGYNETTTHAMMQIIAATIAAYGAAFPTETSEEFCDTHPQLMTKHVLRLFYSPERRVHPDAKTQFVAPDLAPLPAIHER